MGDNLGAEVGEDVGIFIAHALVNEKRLILLPVVCESGWLWSDCFLIRLNDKLNDCSGQSGPGAGLSEDMTLEEVRVSMMARMWLRKSMTCLTCPGRCS